MASFTRRSTFSVVSAFLLLALVANVFLTIFGDDSAGILEVLSSVARNPTLRTLEIKLPSVSDSASEKRLQYLGKEVAEVRLTISDLWQTVTELKAHAALPRTDESGSSYVSEDFTPPFTPTAFSCPAPKMLASMARQSITSDADLTATHCGTPVSRGFLFNRLRFALVAEGPGLTSAQAGEEALATIHACPVSEDHSIANACRELALWGRLKGPSSVFNANISAQHSNTACQWKVSYVVPRDAVVDVQTYELQLVNTWYGGPVGPKTATCNEVADAIWLPVKGVKNKTSLEISYRNGPKYLGSNSTRFLSIQKLYELTLTLNQVRTPWVAVIDVSNMKSANTGALSSRNGVLVLLLRAIFIATRVS
jgi:hypothetical protein